MHGSTQSSRPRTLLLLILASIGCIIIGLAGPHLPLEQTKEGVNVILVLDVSGSMQANDYQPTRLESAKRSAEILLKSLEAKDYAGIITFESGATSAAYLSPDKDRVIKKLQGIEPKEGATAIGDGLAAAGEADGDVSETGRAVPVWVVWAVKVVGEGAGGAVRAGA